MSTPAEWENALSKPPAAFIVRLERLGTDASCRALSCAEAAECMEMGGERGARYALWLACADLREAGELMRKKGGVLSAFDFTEKLPYADVMAAAAAIFERSGASAPLVTVTGERGGAESAALPPPEAVTLASVPEVFLNREPLSEGNGDTVSAEAVNGQAYTRSSEEGLSSISASVSGQPRSKAAPYELRGVPPYTPSGTDAERIAAVLAARLRDASGNM